MTATRPPRSSARSAPARAAARKPGQRKKKRGAIGYTIAYVGIAVIAVAAVVAFVTTRNGGASSTAFAAGASIDGIPCGPMEGQVQHVHQHLDFVIDGRVITPPESVGIVPDKANPQNIRCMYWVHTHTPDGIIHVEAPVKDTLTLGQFLDIWSVSSVDRTLWNRVNAGAPDRVIVNGKPYTGDIRTIPLLSHTQITIEYGAQEVPQRPFDFKAVGLPQ